MLLTHITFGICGMYDISVVRLGTFSGLVVIRLLKLGTLDARMVLERNSSGIANLSIMCCMISNGENFINGGLLLF